MTEELDRTRWAELIAEARATGHVLHEGQTDGATLEVSISVQTLGGSDYLLVVATDISRRRALEAQLTRSNRLASLGTLAAGVAHEVNNPLAYVSGNLELLGERMTGENLELVEEALEGAFRIREIVKDLSALARPQAPASFAPVRLSEVLDTSVRFASRSMSLRASFTRIGDQELDPVVLGQRLQLSQVFLNLLINASQAIPEGERERHQITLRTEPPRDGFVRVEVSDTGEGMAKRVREQVFDPFFTTKPAGSGTGLGLSICHRIVRSVGGRISVESEEGAGTTFRVELPVADPSGRRASTLPPAERRVLVVDPDPDVARAVKGALVGYRVVRAPTGEEAQDLLSRFQFDAVLYEPTTPGLDERVLHDLADSIGARRLVIGASGTVSKPLDPVRLRRALGSFAS